MRGKKQAVLKAREILSDVKRTNWARLSFGFALVLFLSLCRTRSRLAYHIIKNTSFQLSKEENSLSLKNHYFCSSNTEKLFVEKSQGRTKIDPMLRAENIFSPLHQGRTYCLEGVGK